MSSPRGWRMNALGRVGASVLALGLALLPAAAPVLAADTLTLTTPYPSVVVSPDSTVSFELSVDTPEAARVDLSVTGTPASWSSTLRGGGFVVGAVETNGTDPTSLRLDVVVPADATGSARVVVTAASGSQSVELPLDIKVEAQAAGEITVQPDFPAQRGAADTTFTFNLNIRNGRDEDLTYTASGQGPVGWTVDAKPTGQAQAASGIAKANGTAGVGVTVTPADNAAAGTYQIDVVVTVGSEQLTQQLSVEITGNYHLDLSTPDQVLSGHGPSGSATEQQFSVTNSGTAPLTNVRLTASPPTNWTVDFDQTSIATIAPGETVTVTAQITPSGSAVAGDYSLTVRATGAEANDSVEIRFTVEASILGAVVGAGLILLAIGGLFWVFRTYGRR